MKATEGMEEQMGPLLFFSLGGLRHRIGSQAGRPATRGGYRYQHSKIS